MKTSSPIRSRWLTSTVLGIGLASLFGDWSHEIATTLMPAFLATMGIAAAWLGLIEGGSDGLSSFSKMATGYYTDRLRRRKSVAVAAQLIISEAHSGRFRISLGTPWGRWNLGPVFGWGG